MVNGKRHAHAAIESGEYISQQTSCDFHIRQINYIIFFLLNVRFHKTVSHM